MRTAPTLLAVFSTIALGARPVDAQSAPLPDPQLAPLAEPQLDLQAYQDARLVADVGMGLTIAGLGTTAIGGGFAFTQGAFLGGPILWGIGGAVVLAGIPTWIVGGVRASITAHATPEAQRREADEWETAGIATFTAGLGLTLLGAILMGAGSALGDSDEPEWGLFLSGMVMIPVGAFVALFVGAPMWAEGARF